MDYGANSQYQEEEVDWNLCLQEHSSWNQQLMPHVSAVLFSGFSVWNVQVFEFEVKLIHMK